MTESNEPEGDAVTHQNIWNGSVHVDCPHCNRDETFGDELTAYAWVVGHIQETHDDELPAYGAGE